MSLFREIPIPDHNVLSPDHGKVGQVKTKQKLSQVRELRSRNDQVTKIAAQQRRGHGKAGESQI